MFSVTRKNKAKKITLREFIKKSSVKRGDHNNRQEEETQLQKCIALVNIRNEE